MSNGLARRSLLGGDNPAVSPDKIIAGLKKGGSYLHQEWPSQSPLATGVGGFEDPTGATGDFNFLHFNGFFPGVAAYHIKGAGQTLVLDVTADFAAGDQITISDLGFDNFSAASDSDNLELVVSGASGPSAATDDKLEHRQLRGCRGFIRPGVPEKAPHCEPCVARSAPLLRKTEPQEPQALLVLAAVAQGPSLVWAPDLCGHGVRERRPGGLWQFLRLQGLFGC